MESDQHLVKVGVHLDYKVVLKKIRFLLVLANKEGHGRPLTWAWINCEFKRQVRVCLGHADLCKKRAVGKSIWLTD